MNLSPLWIGVVALGLAPAPDTQPEARAAEEPAASARALDARVRRAVVRVIREGVVLFNERRDPTGCYRLFQGALIGIEPLLAHRPELQEAIGQGLDRAAGLAGNDVARAALELRGVLDQAYEATRAETPRGPTLWERLGGEAAVREIVHDFVALAAGDEDVDFFRDGRYAMDTDSVERLEQLMVEYLSAATGGPLRYSGRPMGATHEGMGITEDEFNALAADLVAVLRKHEVPQAEIDELLGIVATTRAEVVELGPLWGRLGGEGAVRALVADVVDRAARNPEVNFTRDGRFPLDEAGADRLKDRIVAYLSEATGGPIAVEGSPLGEAARGLGITPDEFDAIVADLAAALRDAEVAPDLAQELIAVVEAAKPEVVEAR